MSPHSGNLSIGDWVVLTKKGAKAHREHHQNMSLTTGALTGAVMLPLALPGGFLATIGIVGGGAGIAVAGTTQAAVGAAGGAGVLSHIKRYLENHPEAQAIGVIKDKQRRWFGQDGHDYEVVWSNEEPLGKSSWHLSKHLLKIDPPSGPSEIPIT
ncbi:hypothetical protein [Acaryochloris marina]|uniref:hypothetical protein n=1 Tax=Acaryochloris marina TaxID=155978 RepID=UPI001BAEB5B4|nr:hypothetical protein [Acaryochloris marina]QUY45605.1 hypothetical protein I1H34_28050 [Acaryochloris marina S15]